MTQEEVAGGVETLKAALSIERRKLREVLDVSIKLAQDLRTARADGWDDGFEAGYDFVDHTPRGVSIDPPMNPYRG